MTDLKPTFEHYYPENSKGPGEGIYAGQCGSFAHAVIDTPFRFGDKMAAKRQAIHDHGMTVAQVGGRYLPGDILILDIGTREGHITVVNNVMDQRLRLSEANWDLDGKVHHTRIIVPSNQIIGVYRRPLKVAVINPIQYPMEIHVQALFNNQHWDSEQLCFVEAANEVFRVSNGKLNITWFPSLYTNYTDIPFGVYMFPFGGGSADAPTPDWYLETLYPKNSAADALLFIANRQDWKDTNQNNGYTFAYCHLQYPPAFPPFISTMIEENDMAWNHPTVKAFTQYVKHELCHQFYNISGIRDRTHELDELGQIDQCYNEFDYDKINLALTNKRNLKTPMYGFKKENDPTIYVPWGNRLIPVAANGANFKADYPDVVIIPITADQLAYFKIASKTLIKDR